MAADKYTKEHYHQVLIGLISALDNQLLVIKHEGNRHAIELKLDVLREIYRKVVSE